MGLLHTASFFFHCSFYVFCIFLLDVSSSCGRITIDDASHFPDGGGGLLSGSLFATFFALALRPDVVVAAARLFVVSLQIRVLVFRAVCSARIFIYIIVVAKRASFLRAITSMQRADDDCDNDRLANNHDCDKGASIKSDCVGGERVLPFRRQCIRQNWVNIHKRTDATQEKKGFVTALQFSL